MKEQEETLQQLQELQSMWLFINDKKYMSIDDNNDKATGTGIDRELAEQIFKDKFKLKFRTEPFMAEHQLNLTSKKRSN